MSEGPFQVDRFGDSKAKIPGDVLRPIPPVDRRSVARQLIDNLKVTFAIKPKGLKTPEAQINVSSHTEL